MITLEVILDERQKAFVDSQAAAGGHASPADYLLALVRDAERRKAWRQVEEKVLIGLDSPAAEMSEQDWRSLQDQITGSPPPSTP